MKYKAKNGLEKIQFNTISPKGKVIDCKRIANSIKATIKKLDGSFVIVRPKNDVACEMYTKGIMKDAVKLGWSVSEVIYPHDMYYAEFKNMIHGLAFAPIVLQIPKYLKYGLGSSVPDYFDVDGVLSDKVFTPCTAEAIVEILSCVIDTSEELHKKHFVLVGTGETVGKPLVKILQNYHVTLTMCNSSTTDLKTYTKQADVLIVAVGHPNLITADMVKQNAIVIDAGINSVDGKTVGDVDFENVKQKCSYITPVPNGVGLVTRAVLMKHIEEAIRHKKEWVM